MSYIPALIVSAAAYAAFIALFSHVFEIDIPLGVQVAVVVAQSAANSIFALVQTLRKDKK